MREWYKLIPRSVFRQAVFVGGAILLGINLMAAVSIAYALWHAWRDDEWDRWDWVPDPRGPPVNGASKRPEKVAESVAHEK